MTKWSSDFAHFALFTETRRVHSAAVPAPESTCWTVIHAAAAGSSADREELARRYLGVVRAYLTARWRGLPNLADIDDAGQEVFVECFRNDGVLDAAAAGRVPSFRAFLYGVIRNVARRFESRTGRTVDLPSELAADETSQSRLFDRTWAESLMAEAAQLQQTRAKERGGEFARRVELLRLRFEENRPIRTIAEAWGVPAGDLHHAYAQARQEFRAILLEVVSFHSPGPPDAVAREAAELLTHLAG
jgi:DNA-directed RNA polymerase specialized sigma24 family protein